MHGCAWLQHACHWCDGGVIQDSFRIGRAPAARAALGKSAPLGASTAAAAAVASCRACRRVELSRLPLSEAHSDVCQDCKWTEMGLPPSADVGICWHLVWLGMPPSAASSHARLAQTAAVLSAGRMHRLETTPAPPHDRKVALSARHLTVGAARLHAAHALASQGCHINISGLALLLRGRCVV